MEHNRARGNQQSTQELQLFTAVAACSYGGREINMQQSRLEPMNVDMWRLALLWTMLLTVEAEILNEGEPGIKFKWKCGRQSVSAINTRNRAFKRQQREIHIKSRWAARTKISVADIPRQRGSRSRWTENNSAERNKKWMQLRTN
jgi:hypothetical protein